MASRNPLDPFSFLRGIPKVRTEPQDATKPYKRSERGDVSARLAMSVLDPVNLGIGAAAAAFPAVAAALTAYGLSHGAASMADPKGTKGSRAFGGIEALLAGLPIVAGPRPAPGKLLSSFRLKDKLYTGAVHADAVEEAIKAGAISREDVLWGGYTSQGRIKRDHPDFGFVDDQENLLTRDQANERAGAGESSTLQAKGKIGAAPDAYRLTADEYADVLDIAGGDAAKAEALLRLEEPRVLGYYAPDGSLVDLKPQPLDHAIAEAHNKGGGSTFSPSGENKAGANAWAVSSRGHEHRIANTQITPEDVARYRASKFDELKQPGAHVGTWVNDGETFLDVSTLEPDVSKALTMGEKNQQRGIWHLGEELELPVARTQARMRWTAVRDSPKKYREMVAELESGLNPQELETFRGMNRGVQRRTVRAYALAPDPETFSSAILAGSSARGWYRSTAEAIKTAFGDESKRFGALLAALSPQKDVPTNVRQALHAFSDWHQAGRPTDPAALEGILRASAKKVGTAYYGNETANGVRALSAPLQEIRPGFISGPKADPFYQNVMGELDALTNDTWQARAYGTGKMGVNAPSRNLAQRAMMRNALRHTERRTGVQGLQQAEGQETSWSFTRGASNASRRGRRQGGITDALLKARANPEQPFAQGRTLEEHIRNADAISDLLAHPDNAELLRLSGARTPEYRPAEGLSVSLQELLKDKATVGQLSNIAQRANASFSGKPFYSIAAFLGLNEARRKGEDR